MICLDMPKYASMWFEKPTPLAGRCSCRICRHNHEAKMPSWRRMTHPPSVWQ